MKDTSNSLAIRLLIYEVCLAIVLGMIYVKLFLDQEGIGSNDYLVGFIFKFYGGLSLIIFLSVFSVGIAGAIKLNRSNNILRAVFYSIGFWILSLIISLILFNFIYILSLLVILIGVVYGFYKGIMYNSDNENL